MIIASIRANTFKATTGNMGNHISNGIFSLRTIPARTYHHADEVGRTKPLVCRHYILQNHLKRGS